MNVRRLEALKRQAAAFKNYMANALEADAYDVETRLRHALGVPPGLALETLPVPNKWWQQPLQGPPPASGRGGPPPLPPRPGEGEPRRRPPQAGPPPLPPRPGD